MKLYKYELWKILKNKFFVIASVVLLAMCSIIFYFVCSSQPIDRQEYKRIHHKIDRMSLHDATAYVQELKEVYTFYNEYQILQQEDVWKQYEQTKGHSWVVQQLAKLKHKSIDDILRYQTLLKRINKELVTVEQYAKYRTNMVKQVQTNQEISIFKENTHVELNAKVLRAYEVIDKNLKLTITPTLGVENVISYAVPSVVCLLLILYMLGIMVYQERKRGFTSFTETMRKGKQVQYFAKLAALITVSCTWLLSAYVLCGMIAQSLYSLPPFHSYIQGIPLLMKSTIDGDIALLLVMFFIHKVVVTSLLCGFGYVLSQRIASYFGMLCIMGGAVAISYIGYTQIPELSSWSALKYVNLYGFMQPIDYLGNYICFSIAQYPFSILQGILFVALSIAIVVFLVSFLTPLKLRKNHSRKKYTRKGHPRSLLLYECKKIWIKDFGLLVLLFYYPFKRGCY